MYQAVSPQAYDRAITVFSPDGRLFQVEYAKEAVRRGATGLGIVTKDGVVMAAMKNIQNPLLVSKYMKKIFKIDEHMAAAASGLVADARRMIDMARVEAQRNRVSYNEPAGVDAIAKNLSDVMQVYTQYGGIRPFGVSLLIGGVDDEPKLFELEPSGALTGYKAVAIGSGKKEAEEVFEKEYKDDMSLESAVLLAIRALKKTITEGQLTSRSVDLAVIKSSSKKFETISDKQIDEYIGKA